MKTFTKCIMLAIMVFSIMWLNTTFLLAAEMEKPVQFNSSEKLYIEQSFEESKAPLEVDKKNWGLSDSEYFSDAELGDGIPFYVFSENFLNSEQGENNALTLEGFIFPIKVGEKPVGIAVYRYINGKLTKAEIGNTLNFEQEITNGKNILKSDLIVKLIYDKKTVIFALAVQNETGYDLLPILSTRFYGFKHYQLKPLAECSQEIRQVYQTRKNNPGKLGGGEIKTKSSSINKVVNYSFAGLVLIAISAGAFTLFRKKHVG